MYGPARARELTTPLMCNTLAKESLITRYKWAEKKEGDEEEEEEGRERVANLFSIPLCKALGDISVGDDRSLGLCVCVPRDKRDIEYTCVAKTFFTEESNL